MNSKDFRNIREAKKLLKEAEIKKARLSRTTDLFGGGPDKISNVDSTVKQFMQTFNMNRNSAYKKYNLTDEEIKAVEKAHEKVLQAREDFIEFLTTMNWE